MMAYNCHLRDSRNLKRGISWSRLAWAKKLISKITTADRAGDMDQLVVCLPSKGKYLSSNHS
jgi:hypothetical protein